MAHYRCEQCAAIVEAEDAPEACESCGAPAEDAFPAGAASAGLIAQSSVEFMFDQGLRRRDRAGKETSAATGPIQPSRTLELEDGDVEEVAGPPPPPRPLSRALGEQRRPRPPEAPAANGEPRELPGRVAYPMTDASPAPRRSPSEIDELAAAGLPPRPVREGKPLPGQTERLDSRRKRRLMRRLRQVGLVVLVIGVFAGIGLGVSWFGARAPGGPQDGGSVDEDGGRGARIAAPVPAPIVPDSELPPASPLADPDAGGDVRPDGQQRERVPARGGEAAGAGRSASAAAGRKARRGRTFRGSRGTSPSRPQKADAGVRALDPVQAREMYSEGLKSLLRGDTERAVERFKAALKRNPRLNLAHRGLGLAYEKLGQTAKALGAYKRYLAARPDAPDRSSIERRIEKLER